MWVFPPPADQSGSGWQSNPPGVFSDATLGLKPQATLDSAALSDKNLQRVKDPVDQRIDNDTAFKS